MHAGHQGGERGAGDVQEAQGKVMCYGALNIIIYEQIRLCSHWVETVRLCYAHSEVGGRLPRDGHAFAAVRYNGIHYGISNYVYNM